MRWSKEQDDELARLRALNWSASEIGASMKLTRNAVIGRSHRLGLGRRWPHDQRRARTTPVVRAARAVRRRPIMIVSAPIAPVVPIVPIVPPPAPAGPCTLIDLTNASCRWPIGTEIGLYCGRPEADMSAHRPYCPEHARKAWTQPRR